MKEVISPERIQARVAELAQEIKADHQGHDLLLVGILKGAFIFLSDLARQLGEEVEIDFVRLASYGSGMQSSGEIRLTKDLELELNGRTVLVVEDIVDTGLTLKWFVDHLRDRGVQDVKICALIDKPERREIKLDLDYVGFEIPSGFLVGYGLDYGEKYRGLPGIYELEL